MRTPVNLAISSLVLAAGLSLHVLPLRAIPEYTAKESKECEFCHPGNDPYALNEAGKYYADYRSFEGYGEPEAPPPSKPDPAKPQPGPAKPEPVPASPAPSDPAAPAPQQPKPDPAKPGPDPAPAPLR
jgi:hypothetical protein